MRRKGVAEYLIQWTRSFLYDRRSLLEVGEASLEVRPRYGVPQGSPRSQPLFLVFIDDLLWALSRAWVA